MPRFSHAPADRPLARAGFTLIELILVMAILTIAIAYTAPALARFFRGRSLDSEARRFLALTHEARSRAVYEGIPMDLWMDTQKGTYGVTAEPGYETEDPKAIELTVEPGLRLEPDLQAVIQPKLGDNPDALEDASPAPLPSTAVLSRFPNLPRIRFQPDNTIAPESPTTIRVIAQDESMVVLTQTRSRTGYEIRTGK